jgi:hypothetical protein
MMEDFCCAEVFFTSAQQRQISFLDEGINTSPSKKNDDVYVKVKYSF